MAFHGKVAAIMFVFVCECCLRCVMRVVYGVMSFVFAVVLLRFVWLCLCVCACRCLNACVIALFYFCDTGWCVCVCALCACMCELFERVCVVSLWFIV